MKRVIGIGNALTDMLVNLKTDSVLGRFKLAKGSMSLVDTRLQTEISKSVAGLPYSLSLGGSAGNTIRAMAQLGCSVGFIGKVGPDTTGDFFVQALDNLGIEPIIFRGRERSGKCVSLISADGERTMVTHLGAALELSAGEIEPSIFEGYDCLYVEGYLVQNHDLILKAARTAKKCGLKVAIDLASFNIVAENLEFLRGLVSEHVDIVFANEDEAKTFTCEAEPLNALQAISQMCELAVVKIGTKGALIKQGEEVVHVGIMAAAKRVDTTGAGDFYAAGFLAGLCDGLSLRQCGTFRARRYRKVPNLVNVHSWMPVAFNPFAAVDEHVIDLNVGLTLISQNLLSSTEAYASYGWNRHEGSLVNLGVRYFGLGVRFDLDASYGGNQLFYSLAGRDGQGNPVYQSRPAPDKYYSVGLSATLPLYFQRGYHTRQLSLSAGWNYSNGMVADLGKIEWENGSISNIQRVGFREGLHKVSFGAGFSDQVRMAHRDIAPRWGYTFSANYTFNPENTHFSDLISFYGQAYLPGFAPHNSVLVAATYQTSIGGYKFPSGYAPLSYKSTRLVPRGFTSADIVSNNYTAFQANYQLPVWYPEGGIGSVIYIKRIRLNAGGDYAQFRDVGRGGMTWRRIWSVGGDIVFDFNAFRQPASATSTFKLSCYHPSSGGVYVAASVGLPF